ncbi:PAS domain-containing protein [Methanoregula sp.]|uniref:PAS domain-containing protein n=1 Tax=Methanoregula sp. TaxID=2052170 RepID=UPI002375BB2C|nr:PAS domain-containing protein [Methanoregula sp.]MDD1685900.1 PAS domain-containing protein [Methanoregula sp.]
MISIPLFLKRQTGNASFWLGMILITTLLALLINILSLQNTYNTIAPDLFYLPVVIAAYWYPDRGPLLSVLISGAYLGMVSFMGAVVQVMITATIACFVLIGVSIVVSSIATHMRTNETKYRGLFNHSQAGVGVVDPATQKIVEVNQHASAMLGYSEDEILNIPFSALFADPDKKDLFFCQLKQNRSVENFEARFRSKNGGYRWILISAGMLADSRFVATIIDITDRKNTEIALRIKDHAISTSINAIGILDLDFNTTYVNKAFIALMGCRDDTDLIGKGMNQTLMSNQHFEKIRSAVMTRGSWFGEIGMLKYDRTPFYALLWINQVQNDKGEPICIMAFFIDITDRKQMEADKRQALQQIEKNIEQFAILGDNIRNPLAVIVGLASLYDGDVSDRILMQAKEIDLIVTRLDKGWIESENVRNFIRKYYNVGTSGKPDPKKGIDPSRR